MKSKTIRDDELQARLGLFLENNHAQGRQKHKHSLSSLGSNNTSPLSTLTNSSEADVSRHDKLQTSKLQSIGSLLSVSISEHSNASSNSLGRHQSITGMLYLISKSCKLLLTSSILGQLGNPNQIESIDEFGTFKARKTTARRSARSVQLSSPIDPKIRFAQFRQTLPLKPLFFEVPHQEADPIFVGRNWLVREISNVIATSDCKGVLINGSLGTGKTMFMLQMVENSCFGRKKDTMGNDHDGIYSQANVPHERLRQLAGHVVAYHFCQSDNSPTCAVPDFIHSIAAQLCQAPQLAAYHEFLLSEPHLQNVLSIKECIADPQRALKMGILEPLEALKRQGKILVKYCIILIDALCESEYHRPDYGDTITSFLSTMCHSFPSWLKVIGTVRSQMIDYTSSLPFTKLTLDNWLNDALQKDILDYIILRVSNSPQIQNNISSVLPNGMTTRDGASGKFAQHLLSLCKGSFLFAKLTLDLIERGSLVIKSNSFKVLPVTLSQIFLLSFNLRFPTQSAFDKVSSILSVCLAALHPLTLLEIFHSVNSLVTEAPLEWNEFLNRFKMLAGFLVKRIDNSYMFFHPSFKEWLILRRDESESSKFLCDLRTGHAAIAFRMSRLQAPLDGEGTLELCHHILKAHIYRNPPISHASPRDLQAYWVSSSSKCLSTSLCTLKNVYCPNLKASRLLLLAGADPNHQTGFFGDAPLLCIVAHEGIIGMVNLLLEFGADIEKTNNQGFTPLILAATKGYYEIVQQLVASGSSLGQTDAQKRCALVHASLNGHTQIVKFLLACDWFSPSTQDYSTLMNSAKQSLVAAASRGHSSIVAELLATLPDLDVDAVDYITGESSLTISSSNGHIDTVSVLLSRGANHDNKNRKGMTALLLASKEGHWNICERLIQSGADIEQKDPNGRNSLMISAEEGHVGILELLLDKGADHRVTNKDGLTPLGWACLRGKLEACKSLLEHNADIRQQDNHQRTPLDLASYQGTGELVQLLLENGAQLEHVDEKGMRPIDRAIACRNIKVVQVSRIRLR
jgi:ankyrin repeat protein